MPRFRASKLRAGAVCCIELVLFACGSLFSPCPFTLRGQFASELYGKRAQHLEARSQQQAQAIERNIRPFEELPSALCLRRFHKQSKAS